MTRKEEIQGLLAVNQPKLTHLIALAAVTSYLATKTLVDNLTIELNAILADELEELQATHDHQIWQKVSERIDGPDTYFTCTCVSCGFEKEDLDSSYTMLILSDNIEVSSDYAILFTVTDDIPAIYDILKEKYDT